MVISQACVSCGRCIGTDLLFCCAFQKIENEILGVVALRPHTNSHSFRHHWLLVDSKEVSGFLEGPQRIASRGSVQVLSEVLATVYLENGLHLVATEGGCNRLFQLDDGEVGLQLVQRFHWFEGL